MDAQPVIAIDAATLPWEERFNEKLGRALIIENDLYQIGGTSKIVEDLSRELTSHVEEVYDLFLTRHN